MSADGDRGLRILHVEDNSGDVRLVAEALKETGSDHEVAVVSDGADALEYLYRRGSYADAPRPDLILLDLNLPKKDGLEVLAEIKADSSLKTIPVVVFTSSSSPRDINQAYRYQASCYVAKPAELDDLFRVIGVIEEFWLGTVKRPPPGSG
jgi:chemotaxis family two-component system response regulator Rcp1